MLGRLLAIVPLAIVLLLCPHADPALLAAAEQAVPRGAEVDRLSQFLAQTLRDAEIDYPVPAAEAASPESRAFLEEAIEKACTSYLGWRTDVSLAAASLTITVYEPSYRLWGANPELIRTAMQRREREMKQAVGTRRRCQRCSIEGIRIPAQGDCLRRITRRRFHSIPSVDRGGRVQGPCRRHEAHRL